MTKVEEMWAALAAYQPEADAAGYGKSWAKMCSEKTADDAFDAAYAAAADAAAYDAAADAAYAAAWAAAASDAAYAARAAVYAASAEKYAQKAIAAIEEALAQPGQEPVMGTKTWFENGKVVTQHLTAKDIYKEPEQEPVARVLALEDALKEIAYAGMSPPFDMSDDSKTAWHARQAWNFIGIASRGLTQKTEDTK